MIRIELLHTLKLNYFSKILRIFQFSNSGKISKILHDVAKAWFRKLDEIPASTWGIALGIDRLDDIVCVPLCSTLIRSDTRQMAEFRRTTGRCRSSETAEWPVSISTRSNYITVNIQVVRDIPNASPCKSSCWVSASSSRHLASTDR